MVKTDFYIFDESKLLEITKINTDAFPTIKYHCFQISKYSSNNFFNYKLLESEIKRLVYTYRIDYKINTSILKEALIKSLIDVNLYKTMILLEDSFSKIVDTSHKLIHNKKEVSYSVIEQLKNMYGYTDDLLNDIIEDNYINILNNKSDDFISKSNIKQYINISRNDVISSIKDYKFIDGTTHFSLCSDCCIISPYFKDIPKLIVYKNKFENPTKLDYISSYIIDDIIYHVVNSEIDINQFININVDINNRNRIYDYINSFLYLDYIDDITIDSIDDNFGYFIINDKDINNLKSIINTISFDTNNIDFNKLKNLIKLSGNIDEYTFKNILNNKLNIILVDSEEINDKLKVKFICNSDIEKYINIKNEEEKYLKSININDVYLDINKIINDRNDLRKNHILYKNNITSLFVDKLPYKSIGDYRVYFNNINSDIDVLSMISKKILKNNNCITFFYKNQDDLFSGLISSNIEHFDTESVVKNIFRNVTISSNNNTISFTSKSISNDILDNLIKQLECCITTFLTLKISTIKI